MIEWEFEASKWRELEMILPSPPDSVLTLSPTLGSRIGVSMSIACHFGYNGILGQGTFPSGINPKEKQIPVLKKCKSAIIDRGILTEEQK